MRLKTALLLALTCVLTFGADAQNQSPQAYGNITASGSACTTTGACVQLNFPNTSTGVVALQVTGTWVATLQFEGSADSFGDTWIAMLGTPYNSNVSASSTAANGTWQVFVGGLTRVRVRASAYTSGTAAIVINSSSAVGAGAVSVGGTGALAQDVQGAVASGTSNAGINPVLLGCDAAGTTVSANQISSVKCGTNGSILTLIQQTAADGSANASAGAMSVPGGAGAFLEAFTFVFNGASWDRPRSADLTNYNTAVTTTAANSVGATLVEKGSRWSVFSNPAAGSQATASIAAEASVRHVADCVSFSGGSIVAPALTALTVNLRDGATGAGTVIWTQQVIISAATGQNVAPFTACGLNLTGTTNTAMTLEFSAALASLSESATISGFNIN